MAVSSQVQICNLALGYIGHANTIQSLSENSTAAIRCNLVYEQSRDSLIRSFDWNFARTSVTLALSGTAPGHWSYSYAMPSEALAIRYIFDAAYDPQTNRSYPYELGTNDGETKLIWTDTETAQAVYTRVIRDEAILPELVVDALALKIASEIAMPMTKDLQLTERLNQWYQLKLSAAQLANNQEAYEQPDEWEADHIAARA